MAIWQKLAYHTKCRVPILTYFTGFGRRIGGGDYPNIRLAVADRTLLWQPVKFGRCSQILAGGSLLFALAFNSGLDDRKSAFKRLNGNNPATSCTNLVNFCPIILVFTQLKCTIFCHDSVAIWRRSLFVTLAFWNGLDDHNFDFSKVIGNHLYTSCRNLWDSVDLPRSLKHKRLYSRRQKFFWGDFRYIQ